MQVPPLPLCALTHTHTHTHTHIHTHTKRHTHTLCCTQHGTEHRTETPCGGPQAHHRTQCDTIQCARTQCDTILWWVFFTNATGLSVVFAILIWQLCCYIGTVCISPFFAFALSQVLSRGAGNEEEPQIQHGHNRVLMVGVKSFVFTNHCATDAFSIFCEHLCTAVYSLA